MPTKTKSVPSKLTPNTIADLLANWTLKPASDEGRFTGTIEIEMGAGAWGDLFAASLGRGLPLGVIVAETVENHASEARKGVAS